MKSTVSITPEGVRFVVAIDFPGHWTLRQVTEMLMANGLDDVKQLKKAMADFGLPTTVKKRRRK